MFAGCYALIKAPSVLRANSLEDGCYSYMFYRCESLTTAPFLPATTLVNNCYDHMFTRASKLNYVKMLATDISATSCLDGWLGGVAATGTFVKHPNMNDLSTIPNNWTVENATE